MMTITSEYAIRAVGYLATTDPEKRVGSDEIAEATHVPKRFLLKIMNTLKNQGFLKTSRGIGGGFSLAKSPESFTLFDIVSVFEDISRHVHCLSGDINCNPDNPCPLHEQWYDITNRMDKFLKDITFKHFQEFKERNEKKQ